MDLHIKTNVYKQNKTKEKRSKKLLTKHHFVAVEIQTALTFCERMLKQDCFISHMGIWKLNDAKFIKQ